MRLYPGNEIYRERTYRIRYQKSLINQIKADHFELVRLWDRIENREKKVEDTERILERIAWINRSIYEIDDINKNNIEA